MKAFAIFEILFGGGSGAHRSKNWEWTCQLSGCGVHDYGLSDSVDVMQLISLQQEPRERLTTHELIVTRMTVFEMLLLSGSQDILRKSRNRTMLFHLQPRELDQRIVCDPLTDNQHELMIMLSAASAELPDLNEEAAKTIIAQSLPCGFFDHPCMRQFVDACGIVAHTMDRSVPLSSILVKRTAMTDTYLPRVCSKIWATTQMSMLLRAHAYGATLCQACAHNHSSNSLLIINFHRMAGQQSIVIPCWSTALKSKDSTFTWVVLTVDLARRTPHT